MGTFKCCVQSAFCRVWDGASAACFHITSEDSEPLCTWLKPDSGLTGSSEACENPGIYERFSAVVEVKINITSSSKDQKDLPLLTELCP